MDLKDNVVVITGGASGIGRAMAERFAREGAHVVVSDVDGEAAERVAGEIGGLAIRTDVTDSAQVEALIDRAEDELGPVNLFCANAGVGRGNGVETPDELWDEAFDVNVRAHITAARLLVPRWIERGGGYFLSTASAAGLLGMIGSAPYPVTKHAAVAFAEWLAFTYGDRGVRVSCLCPMGVKTPFFDEGAAQPGEAGAGVRISNAAAPLLMPDEVADAVVEGLADERFLILPHAIVSDMLLFKANDRDGWLASMSTLAQQASAAAGVGQ